VTNIIAVDPGKRTGIAFIHFDDDIPAAVTYTFDVDGGVDGFMVWLAEFDDIFEDFFIVYENFRPREGKHGVGTDASEVIGALRYWARLREVACIPQSADGRKQAVPDRVLDKFIATSGNSDRNFKEAARHAIWYLKYTTHLPTIKKGWGDGDISH
jgi:hypothetical protein